MKIYNRIDEQGRFLGAVYRADEYGSQEITHGYSVLQCHQCLYEQDAFSLLETLCVAQELAYDEGFVLELLSVNGDINNERN